MTDDIATILKDTPSRPMSVTADHVIASAQKHRRRRLSAITGSAVAAAVVAGGLVLGVGGHLRSDNDITAADLPPASIKSPAQLTAWYLREAKARHCRSTKSITMSNTWNWCNDPRVVDYRNVSTTASPVPPSEIGGLHEECVGFEVLPNEQLQTAAVGKPKPKWEPWELCFMKTRNGYRVYDQGQG